MYVVSSSKWDTKRVSGHDRLLVDAWLECLAEDTHPLYWPPLYSTLQLLRNLLTVLRDIDRGVLKTYQISDLIDELRDRFEKDSWLSRTYPLDTRFLREQLDDLKTRTGDTPDDLRARRTAESLLRAYLQKVDASDPLNNLRGDLCDLAASQSTSFQVLIRGVGELINELIHCGHSRAYLHRWILGAVVNSSTPAPYLLLIRETAELRGNSRRSFEVLFQVACPKLVKNTDQIAFLDALPQGWSLPPDSQFLLDTSSRYAVVTIDEARDVYSAIDEARWLLRRYFTSTRLGHFSFDRSISRHAAARQQGRLEVDEEKEPRGLRHVSLTNDRRFYGIDRSTCNQRTYEDLDRIIYWLEQSRAAADLAQLIPTWTALEFLCSSPGLSDLGAVLERVPPCIVPKCPRWLLIDFWKFLNHAGIEFPSEMKMRLNFKQNGPGRTRAICDLVALFELCLEKETDHPFQSLLLDYPILMSKWYRIRRLSPLRKTAQEELAYYERRLTFDIKSCYRARNTIVHDAVVDVAQVDRVTQRLNLILCTCLDTLLFQFSRNPSLSLEDLHNCNRAHYDKWTKEMKDWEENPAPLDRVINPKVHLLT